MLISGKRRFLSTYSFGFAVAALACLMLVCPALGQRGQDRGRYAPDSEIRSAFSPLVDTVRQSVLTVIADGDARGLATVIDRDGLALAKASDLIGHEELIVKLAAGEEYPCTIINVDRLNDLALIQVKADRPLIPVIFVKDQTELGEWVVCPGPEPRPRAVGVVATVSRGIESPRLVLGVMLRPHPEGLRVDALTQGYGAEQAGIRAGDVITHVEEQKVLAVQQVAERLNDLASGDSVEVLVVRDGRSMKVSIELQQVRPDPRSRSERMNRMGGEVSQRNTGFQSVIQHDAEIDPEDCGGPLVNLDGEVIGLNIARAGRISSYALPSELVLRRIVELKAGIDAGPDAAGDIEGPVQEAASD
ncbi:MAG: PDZ domain-containing protein [Planctomycetota bacterium]